MTDSLIVKSLKLLIEQGEASIHTIGSLSYCQYYNLEGRRCAVGILLPEEDAKYLEEEATGDTIARVAEEILEGNLSGLSETAKTLIKDNKTDLEHLQRIHDRESHRAPERFTAKMKEYLEDEKMDGLWEDEETGAVIF